MFAMQYTIQLPADYDEALISQRVEQRSGLFDNLTGLYHKSFLYSPDDKLYAPFYIWENDAAGRTFLLNDLFRGVIDTFSRPRVRTWSVLATGYGNPELMAHHAVREADLIPADQDLQALVRREQGHIETLKRNPNLYFIAVALDADRWELIRYYLWKDQASEACIGSDCTQHYNVLHVSENPSGKTPETVGAGA